MEIEEIESKIYASLEAMYENDEALLVLNANERTISAKIACYMFPMFPSHNVDVEYNRHGINPKRLEYGNECKENENSLILPDIIVHERGNDSNNLLVIEIKKSVDTRPRECDFEKLTALKTDYHYKYAAFIEIPTGADFTNVLPKIEWK